MWLFAPKKTPAEVRILRANIEMHLRLAVGT